MATKEPTLFSTEYFGEIAVLRIEMDDVCSTSRDT